MTNQNDIEELTIEIKEKLLEKTNESYAVQLLIMLPKIWGIRKIESEFEVP